ncbi:TetR/AcrR family transcriptional regulator [Actinoplanes sp. TFC3]|uniref:TetR/AcrR family transcriptional regulator n=1 Tax=Actinoplanes sp. TFC3 TaxID=1710355 RepID=UPI0008298087|nr:TetR/AcrR family transcriptional regulator [Actinoplanes sp. TFC3]
MTAVGARRQQAAQTEAELKAAAVRVFGRSGYLNAKITDITAEAGRAAGSFYKHFTNKESLLESLLADVLHQGDESVQLEGHDDDFSNRDAVRWHVALYWDFHRRNRVLLDALRQASTIDVVFAQRLRDLTEPDVLHMAGHLQRARDSGLALPGDPVVLASAFAALMSQFAATWQAGEGPDLGRELDDDEAIETLTSLVYSGIGGCAQQ